MPEGDTVWLTARRLHQALADRVLTHVDLRVAHLATVDLTGLTVIGVGARGKHLLVRFDSGSTLHSHLRMDGSWFISRADSRPAGGREHAIRAILGNAQWWATGYRVHDLALIPTADEAALVGHLGPDLLGPDWDLDEAMRRLRERLDRPVGEALIDQCNLAGVGNLYKSEVLFIERVHPWTPVGAIADLRRLITTVRRLMIANREHPEQTTTGLLARDRQHWVYQRSGQPCLRCRASIRHADQGEAPQRRGTYWCPTCQPSGDSRDPACTD